MQLLLKVEKSSLQSRDLSCREAALQMCFRTAGKKLLYKVPVSSVFCSLPVPGPRAPTSTSPPRQREGDTADWARLIPEGKDGWERGKVVTEKL